VVILDGGAADELGGEGLLRAESKVELALSQIGMVVRAGAPKPRIDTVAALRGDVAWRPSRSRIRTAAVAHIFPPSCSPSWVLPSR